MDLPDHDILPHLAGADIAGHHVGAHTAAQLSEVVAAALHALPGRLGDGGEGVAGAINAALHAANKVAGGHDALVDAHHGAFVSPF